MDKVHKLIASCGVLRNVLTHLNGGFDIEYPEFNDGGRALTGRTKSQ